MDRLICRFACLLLAEGLTAILMLSAASLAQASCGSVTCFVVIGSAQQVSPAGLLTVNLLYNYTRQGTLLPGTNGVIPAVDVDNRQLILGHHQELRTLSQTYTVDLNYGLTDRIGLEVMIRRSIAFITISMASVRSTEARGTRRTSTHWGRETSSST